MTKKRFSVIALHPWTGGCDMVPPCSFCYKKKEKTGMEKPYEFWYDLIPYIKQLTNQLVLGSNGEPFMDIFFVEKLAGLCKKEKLIINVTSNGRKLMELSDSLLQFVLKDITMISLSFDREKIKDRADLDNYIKLVQRIKKLTKCQVGCNLLVDNNMFKNKGITLIAICNYLFKYVHRIFCLYPKSSQFIPIIDYKYVYYYLTKKNNHFYIDDESKCILESGSYSNWKRKCHRGKDMISINEDGGISTCSFAKSFTYLKSPEDILKIKIPKEEMGTNNCPFLPKQKDLNRYSITK